MKITTIGQVNELSGCCPCDLPVCEEPRQQCDSIKLLACGWTIEQIYPGQLPDITVEDKRRKYRIRTDTSSTDGSGITSADPSGTGTYTERSFDEQYTTIREYAYDPEVDKLCTTLITTSDFVFTSDTIKNSSDNSLVLRNTSTFTSNSSPTSECSGTITGVSEDPSGATTDIYDLDICSAILNNVDVDWSLSGTSFSKSETTTYDPPETYSQTTVSTTSLSEPITVTYMRDAIALYEYPESGTGGLVPGCRAYVALDEDVPDQPLEVQKFRYRFGIPTGYERSTWEMQWDEVFFPKAYDDWVAGGRVGEQPEDSDPVLVESRDWVWNKNPEKPWSEWYKVDAPDSAGEVRVVNVMVLCWKSSQIGQKPTAHGEVYEFPDEA